MLHLRIELLDVEPAIWRSLRVPASVTLSKLHRIFQITMGWTNSHLHEFRIGGVRYGVPERDAQDRSVVAETRIKLVDALNSSVTQFQYAYDFGDGWEHEVKVETVGSDSQQPLLCLAGANSCPPEDVGGPPGYAEFLKAIRSPRHRDHKRYLTWCGGAFDPAGFDLQGINQALRSLKS